LKFYQENRTFTLGSHGADYFYTIFKTKKMKKVLLSSIILSATLMTGCVSFSTLQTGRVLGEGNFAGTAAFSSINGQILSDSAATTAPMMEFQTTYGITDKLDGFIKIGLLGTSSLGAKYQLLGNDESKGALSFGTSIGTISVSSGTAKTTIWDWTLPVYASYHPTDWLAVYASPKYVMRFTGNYENDKKTNSSTSGWYGGTGGIRVGRKFGFMVEYSAFTTNGLAKPYSQVSAGLTYGGNW
jgi:hypothetical protein